MHLHGLKRTFRRSPCNASPWPEKADPARKGPGCGLQRTFRSGGLKRSGVCFFLFHCVPGRFPPPAFSEHNEPRNSFFRTLGKVCRSRDPVGAVPGGGGVRENSELGLWELSDAVKRYECRLLRQRP